MLIPRNQRKNKIQIINLLIIKINYSKEKLKIQRFTIPRDIYFSDNAIDHLKSIKGTKAMLVIGSQRLIKDGTVPKIQELLKEAKIETIVF